MLGCIATGDEMTQAWLQAIGLGIEYLGVLLLAWEWFAARRQDIAEQEIAALQARREEGRAGLERMQAGNPQMQRHFEMTRDVDRRMTTARIAETRRRYGGLRGKAVATSLALVTLGVVLQLAGTIPGCCELLGIRS